MTDDLFREPADNERELMCVEMYADAYGKCLPTKCKGLESRETDGLFKVLACGKVSFPACNFIGLWLKNIQFGI